MTLELNIQPSKYYQGNLHHRRPSLKQPELVEKARPGGLTWLFLCLNAEDFLVLTCP